MTEDNKVALRKNGEVSVIIPCYNQAHFLGECLRSIVAQSYDKWRAIVVDDHSPDHELIATVIAEISDQRIGLVRHQENRGLAASRNTGARESASKLLLFVDADDRLAPNCLEKLVPVLLRDDSLDCVFPDCQLFGRRNDILEFQGPSPGQFLLRPKDTIPGAGTLMRKRIWESLGGYDESNILRLGREDFEFWIRAFYSGCKCKKVAEPLYEYRISHTSMAVACRLEDDVIAEYIHDKNKAVFQSRKESRQFLSYFYQHAALASYYKSLRGKAIRLSSKSWMLNPSRDTLATVGKTILPLSIFNRIQNGEIRRYVPFIGYPLSSEERYAPFFIVGAARSGNTLLRRVLTSHSKLHIPPETFVLGDCIRRFKKYSRKMNWPDLVYLLLSQFEFHPEFYTFRAWLGPLVERLIDVPRSKRNLAFLLHSFYKYHAEKQGKKVVRWGDKTPLNSLDNDLVNDSAGTVQRWMNKNRPSSVGYGTPQTLERLSIVFPDAQFIHIYRDGCDVAFSTMRGGFVQDIQEAGYRWLHVVRQTRRFVNKYRDRSFEVRYEDLVKNPESTVKSICKFLHVGHESAMLDSQNNSFGLGDVPAWYWHSQVNEAINSKNPGKGRRYLSRHDKEKLQRIIGEELELLCYEGVTADIHDELSKLKPEAV